MISEHTKLFNCVIGLTKNDRYYPTTLRDKGYWIDSVEPLFKNNEGEDINPDLLLTSRKLNHCLVVECKGGNGLQEHDKKQKEKYDKVDKQNFMNIVDNPEPHKIKFNVTYFLSEALSKNIISFKFMDNKHPIILYTNSQLILSRNHGKFTHEELNSCFNNGIIIDGKFPTHYYPFGVDDSEEHIIKDILQTIVNFACKKKSEFSIEEVLNSSHPLWKNFSESHKAKMRERVGNIMRSQNFEKINEYITKSKDRYKINTKALQSLQDACQKLIEKINYDAKQKKLF